MSFQMVLLHGLLLRLLMRSFGTMSFQMVLLLPTTLNAAPTVLELCHSRWFYY